MARAAVRSTMEGYLFGKSEARRDTDLVIITGKGINSENEPILTKTVLEILEREFKIQGTVEKSNQGRVIIRETNLREIAAAQSW